VLPDFLLMRGTLAVYRQRLWSCSTFVLRCKAVLKARLSLPAVGTIPREQRTKSRPCIDLPPLTPFWLVSASRGFPSPVRPVTAPWAYSRGTNAEVPRDGPGGTDSRREGAPSSVAVPFTAHDALGVRSLKPRPRQEAVGRQPFGVYSGGYSPTWVTPRRLRRPHDGTTEPPTGRRTTRRFVVKGRCR
jgi:hypothetical protein